MKLREYVMERKVNPTWTIKGMAAVLGVSHTTLYNVMLFNIAPSYKLACKIEEYTLGAVSHVELMNACYKNHKRNQPEIKNMRRITNKKAPKTPQKTSGNS